MECGKLRTRLQRFISEFLRNCIYDDDSCNTHALWHVPENQNLVCNPSAWEYITGSALTLHRLLRDQSTRLTPNREVSKVHQFRPTWSTIAYIVQVVQHTHWEYRTLQVLSVVRRMRRYGQCRDRLCSRPAPLGDRRTYFLSRKTSWQHLIFDPSSKLASRLSFFES